jgi:hypothetical protein
VLRTSRPPRYVTKVVSAERLRKKYSARSSQIEGTPNGRGRKGPPRSPPPNPEGPGPAPAAAAAAARTSAVRRLLRARYRHRCRCWHKGAGSGAGAGAGTGRDRGVGIVVSAASTRCTTAARSLAKIFALGRSRSGVHALVLNQQHPVGLLPWPHAAPRSACC